MGKNSLKGKADALDIIIGENIRRARVYKNISQTKLASILKISFQQIQKYESGVNRISAANLYAISKALEVDIHLFFVSTETSIDLNNKESINLSKEEAKILFLLRNIESKSIKDGILRVLKTSTGLS